MKVPVSMVPTGSGCAAIAAVILLGLLVFASKKATTAQSQSPFALL